MKKILIRDLTGWPPQSGGSLGEGEVPASVSTQAVIIEYSDTESCKVSFACALGNEKHPYRIDAGDEEIADKVAEVIKNGIGKSLDEIANVEIEI